MNNLIWNTEKDLEDLICELVSWKSRTGTNGEITFANKIKEKLMKLDYFSENEKNIRFHNAGEERNAVSAIYSSGITNKTIVLISHFDTVGVDEFGELKEYAFSPRELTEKYKNRVNEFPDHVQQDIQSDEYLFGRGTMDMKMGLALHMHLLELAITEKWPINLVLVTVPDEEVNSAGMRAAVKGLVGIQQEKEFKYELFLNSEPSFTQKPHDPNYYIYSGSIGKVLPGALFYGKETHAGEPLSGLTGHYMAAYLTKEMEFNTTFREEKYNEKTPLPICLQNVDLKQEYSTQTSHHVASLYNVLLFEKTAQDIMSSFEKVTIKAMKDCEKDYFEICKREKVKPIGEIDVIVYSELKKYAVEKLGQVKVDGIIKEVFLQENLDEREKTIHISDQLMANCSELAPATILFFAPPYYPAVNSSENQLVKDKIKLAQKVLSDKFNVKAKQVHYFNGLSDLSYVNYQSDDSDWKAFKNSTPVWGSEYSIPFADMAKLRAPVMNIGPLGKDAHKFTERLHKDSAFKYTPTVLQEVIKSMF